MREYGFTIVIEKEPEDPGYFAYSPTLRGCFSNGMPVEEARRNMLEAIELFVETMIEDGEDVPQADAPLAVETLTIEAGVA